MKVDVRLLQPFGVDIIDRGDAVVFAFWREEVTVFHFERLKDTLRDELFVALARNDLDDASQRGYAHVAVAPFRSRLEFERSLWKGVNGLGQRSVAFVEEVFEGFGIASAHSRSVRHQIADGDRT